MSAEYIKKVNDKPLAASEVAPASTLKTIIDGKEDTSNKVTAWGSTPSDTKYPSEKLVKTALDGKSDKSSTVSNVAWSSSKLTKTINGTTTDVVSASTLKSAMSLNNVTNDAQVKRSEMGTANGVATLDANGIINTSQLPSYVDDVLEYSAKSQFPATGETGKIYVDTSTNLTWRWSGTTYVEISPSLALGETSSTAYRGDRGKTAYDHSQLTSGNPHNVTAADVKAVRYDTNAQGLTDTQKGNARTNIGAGTSNLTIGTTSSTASAGNHSHGNIANGGTLTDTAATAAGNDYVVIRDADNAKIQTSTIKGTDVADAVSKKHSHSTITLSTTAQAYDGTHTLALPASDPYTTARTPTSHTHGNIQNGGTLQTTDVTIANGDKLVVTDADDSNKIARSSVSFDGSTTTKALTQKGTFESFAKSGDITTAIQALDSEQTSTDGTNVQVKVTEADGKISAVNITTDTTANKNEGVYYVVGTTDYPAWVANHAYAVNDTVNYSNQIRVCKTAHTSGSSYDSSKWNNLGTPVLKGSISGLTALYAGLKIAYKWPCTGGSSSTYLNINGLGNVYIRRNDSNMTTHVPVNTVTFLAYDGTYWRWADYDSNTNNWVTTMGAYCDTVAATQAKTATSTNTVYTAGEAFLIRIVNANTYNGKITLNINSQGAKDVWINGTVSSSTNKTLPAGEHWCYYDGSVFHIWTDGTAQFTKLKASTFTGDLVGNASTATKATQDSDGNAINATYFKSSGNVTLVSNTATKIGTQNGADVKLTLPTIPAAVSVKGNAESSYRTGQVNLTPANLGISATTSSVTVGSTTFNKYTHPTTAGNKHVPSGGSSGQFLGWDSDGTAKWVANPNTDTKVTSSDNHYTPTTASGSDKTASASGATAAWSIDVVKGVTLNTDGKGHVTGLSVTSGKIPGNPNTDTKVKATAKTDNVNYKILATASASPTSGNATEAVYDADITLNPSTNTIAANISGNATTATTATDYNTSSGTIKDALDGKAPTSHTHNQYLNRWNDSSGYFNTTSTSGAMWGKVATVTYPDGLDGNNVIYGRIWMHQYSSTELHADFYIFFPDGQKSECNGNFTTTNIGNIKVGYIIDTTNRTVDIYGYLNGYGYSGIKLEVDKVVRYHGTDVDATITYYNNTSKVTTEPSGIVYSANIPSDTQIVYDCGTGSTSATDFSNALTAYGAGMWVIIHKDGVVYHCVGTFNSGLRFKAFANESDLLKVRALIWTSGSAPTAGTQLEASLIGHTHSQYLTASDITGKVDFGLSNNTSDIGNGAPAADCKSYWESNNIPDNHIKMVYNQPGNEATLIFSKRLTYGSIVKYGYADKYVYILRNQNGTWKSSDWEKISAGYADSAGTADKVGWSAGTSSTERPVGFANSDNSSSYSQGSDFDSEIVYDKDFTFKPSGSGNGDSTLTVKNPKSSSGNEAAVIAKADVDSSAIWLDSTATGGSHKRGLWAPASSVSGDSGKWILFNDYVNQSNNSGGWEFIGTSESAKEIRIPYGSGSIYLQIGVSGSYLSLGTNMADGVMVNYAGEASTAAVAGRLGTASVGSPNNPIYLNNGVPTECNWWVS